MYIYIDSIYRVLTIKCWLSTKQELQWRLYIEFFQGWGLRGFHDFCVSGGATPIKLECMQCM